MNILTAVGSTGFVRRQVGRIAQVLLLAAVPCTAALSQVVPFDEAVALSKDVEPIERSFDVSAAGQYRITLTDLGALLTVPAPAPLDNVHLLVTRGSALVASLDGDADAAPADSVVFDATPGSYVLHVVGKPGTQTGSGPVGVQITNVATSEPVLNFSDLLAPPAAVQSGLRSYQLEVEIPADGAYELVVADLQFPRAGTLRTVGAFLFQTGAAALTACVSVPAVAQCPSTQTVNLTAGKYQLVAGGALVDPPDAGVFSVYFRSVATGAVVHSRTVELGRVIRVGSSSLLLDAGDYTLSLKDLAFPVPLGQAAVMITRAAQVTALASTTLPDKTFTVAADHSAYEVFAYAAAEANEGAGSYDVEVRPTVGAAVLHSTQVVSSTTGVPSAFAFAADITAAGTYRAQFGDFQFPAELSGSRIALVQNGAVVGKTDAATGPTLSLDAPLAVGPATVIAVVKPKIVGGSLSESGATFGLELGTVDGMPVLEATQGVGGMVNVRKASITQAGLYDLRVSDLGFPEKFNDLAVVISRGAQKLGRLIVGSDGVSPGGGSAILPDFDAPAGNYSITLISQPSAPANAATYGISFVASPAAPTVTLTITPTSLPSGDTVGLSWSSQGATSCTASSSPTGVWSGTKSTSGTDSSGPVTAETTFTLTCSDSAGRSAAKSASVTVTAPAESGSGGGGSMDLLTLAVLAIGTGLSVIAARRRAAPRPGQ